MFFVILSINRYFVILRISSGWYWYQYLLFYILISLTIHSFTKETRLIKTLWIYLIILQYLYLRLRLIFGNNNGIISYQYQKISSLEYVSLFFSCVISSIRLFLYIWCFLTTRKNAPSFQNTTVKSRNFYCLNE